MRVVMVGASALSLATGRVLLQRGHEVVIIERDAERLKALGAEIDCGLIHGDGSRPSVLKEVGPEHTDFLLALGEDDQNNILAALVGRELAFGDVIVKIEDPEYVSICEHLGLRNTIVPDLQIGRSLADMLEARGQVSLSARLKGDLRFLSFTVDAGKAGKVGDLGLPKEARVIAVTRDGESQLAADDGELRDGDEVLLILNAKHAPKLGERLLTKADRDDQVHGR
jgi:trk system potassium uptake protein TrkA